jgi:hypothetical protein
MECRALATPLATADLDGQGFDLESTPANRAITAILTWSKSDGPFTASPAAWGGMDAYQELDSNGWANIMPGGC